MRRSPYRKVIHFVHADTLPKDLPVSQFVPKNTGKSSFVFWYNGYVMDVIGNAEPPDSNGFDWVLFTFWVSYFAGYLAISAWVIYWIWS